MPVPYEKTGRIRQKERTRAAMVLATRELLAEGVTPSVEQAADRAGVSRTTSYRYFPNQRALLLASYPELEATSLLGDDAPDDPIERLDRVTASIVKQIVEHEHEVRSALRMSLESPEQPQLLRRGRALAWIEDALSTTGLSKRAQRKLALAIRATCGIEP